MHQDHRPLGEDAEGQRDAKPDHRCEALRVAHRPDCEHSRQRRRREHRVEHRCRAEEQKHAAAEDIERDDFPQRPGLDDEPVKAEAHEARGADAEDNGDAHDFELVIDHCEAASQAWVNALNKLTKE